MKTILIIEDEPIVRQSLVDYFEDRSWYPLEAESGEAALRLLKAQQPLAAIVDIRLPGMDGREFIRTICRRYPAIAVVVCTGSPEFHIPADLQDMPNLSSQIFTKPVNDLEKLLDELYRLIEDLKP